MNSKAHVLVVDDDGLLRDSLRLRLEKDGFQVSLAENGAKALNVVMRDSPDLVLLDLGLPDMDGLEVCRALQQNHHPMAVIFLTGRSSEVDKISGMAIGDDYVTKPFSVNELEARIGMVLRRTRHASPNGTAVIELGGIRLDPSRHQVSVRGQSIELSLKEFDLLQLLMSRAGEVLTTNEILATVWGAEYTGAHELVYVHISGLRQKLCVDPDAPKMIQTVRGVGYRFVPEEP